MALKTLIPRFSFASPPLRKPFPSLRFPLKTLNPASSNSSSQIFLPHLELQNPRPGPQEEAATAAGVREVDVEDDEEWDPLVSFFRSRAASGVGDPPREGRLLLRGDRRSSWHLADVEAAAGDDLGEEFAEAGKNQESDELVLENTNQETGAVQEILAFARSPPENSTLGEFLAAYEGKVGEEECIELLKRMGMEGLAWGCLYLFEWMRTQEPVLVSPRACSVAFPLLGRAGMADRVLVLLENLPPGGRFRDVFVYNAAISGVACCGRYDDAWKILKLMEKNNVRPDHVTCSILITVMRKSRKSAKDAWEFFEQMNRKGVKWSLEVVGALMKSFCDEGLKKEALIIQSEMEKKGIASNAIIYNTLMSAYSKSGQVEESEGLFTEMKERGLQPTIATYNILMDAYSRRMQPEIVETLLLEMQNSGLKPDARSYTCLISAYGRQRKMSEKAADAFLRMKKAGMSPTSHSYTALIHAYSVSGWHEKANIAYENMRREGIKPSIETYTALLDAFRRAGDTEKLIETWKSMLKEKVEGTRVTFNVILDGLAKHGLYVQARDVIYEFGKIGLQPTVMTYNILMNAYARGGQHYKLPQLLKEMSALELKPDCVTYATMIYAYVRVRDFTRAFYYHKQMVRSGQVPDARSYAKLRAILDVKAARKNTRDRSAILGIVNSKFGLKRKKGKKDEFWKNRKNRMMINRVIGDKN